MQFFQAKNVLLNCVPGEGESFGDALRLLVELHARVVLAGRQVLHDLLHLVSDFLALEIVAYRIINLGLNVIWGSLKPYPKSSTIYTVPIGHTNISYVQ